MRAARHTRRDPCGPPILSETAYLRRRELVRALGLGAAWLGAAGPLAACRRQEREAEGTPPGEQTPYGESRWKPEWEPPGGKELYPARRDPSYAKVERPWTPEDVAARHNNYYEFLPGRAADLTRLVGDFEPRPWQVTIAGEVEEERTVDLDELVRVAPLVERVYRFRCVEAWSMVVPWTGVPLRALVDWCRPKATAKYVRFVSFLRPEQAPGQRTAKHYPWPYYEALRIDEARHPLALLACGIFGHALPVQHGAPLRVVVPWKYGYKNPKGIVRIQFTREQPPTFWNDLQPREYGFLSNVEPDVPHPRWSQATERDIATGDRIPTQPYNGYAEEVAALYRA